MNPEHDLRNFKSISLNDINNISLMKRFDTKYVFHKDKLSKVLDFLKNHYSVLEIGEKRFMKYENIYYDTDEHLFYISHHNKKKNRHKIRFRKYAESNDSFLEIKFKNNKDRTIKKRIQITDRVETGNVINERKDFVEKYLPENICPAERLIPSININFSRFTLANVVRRERLTFDIGLEYSVKDSETYTISNIVIAELKQENASRNSPVVEFLKSENIKPSKFSKYCTGIALTKNGIKTNNFKMRLQDLNKYI